MSARETILIALSAAVRQAAERVAGATIVVTRNQAISERLDTPDAAWLNVLDGGHQSPPVGVLGGGWEIDHAARVTIGVRGDDDAARDERFDRIVEALAEAFGEDDTLGGLVDLVELQAVEPPDPELLDLAVGLKLGEASIQLIYTAATRSG